MQYKGRHPLVNRVPKGGTDQLQQEVQSRVYGEEVRLEGPNVGLGDIDSPRVSRHKSKINREIIVQRSQLLFERVIRQKHWRPRDENKWGHHQVTDRVRPWIRKSPYLLPFLTGWTTGYCNRPEEGTNHSQNKDCERGSFGVSQYDRRIKSLKEIVIKK